MGDKSKIALRELLRSLFAEQELRAFVTDYDPALASEMPWRESLTQLTFHFVELLDRHGQLTDARLYEQLRAERPKRRDQIDEVLAGLQVKGKAAERTDSLSATEQQARDKVAPRYRATGRARALAGLVAVGGLIVGVAATWAGLAGSAMRASAQPMLPEVRAVMAEHVVVIAPASRQAEREELCAALSEGGLLTACKEGAGLAELKQSYALWPVHVVAILDDSGTISIGAPDLGMDDCFQHLRVPYTSNLRSCMAAAIRRIHDEAHTTDALPCPPATTFSCADELGLFVRFGASHCDGAELDQSTVDRACDGRQPGDIGAARTCFMASFLYLGQCEQAGNCGDHTVVDRWLWETAPACQGNEARLHVQRADALCGDGDLASAWAAFDKACELVGCDAPAPDDCAAYLVAPAAICLLRHDDDARVAKERRRLEAIGNMTIGHTSTVGDGSCHQQAPRTLAARATQFILIGRYDKAAEDYRMAYRMQGRSDYLLGAAETLILQGKDAAALRDWLTGRRSHNIVQRGQGKGADLSDRLAMQALALLRWRASTRTGQRDDAYRAALEAAYKKMKHGDVFYVDSSNTLRAWLCRMPGKGDADKPCPLYPLLTEPKQAGDLGRLRHALAAAE